MDQTHCLRSLGPATLCLLGTLPVVVGPFCAVGCSAGRGRGAWRCHTCRNGISLLHLQVSVVSATGASADTNGSSVCSLVGRSAYPTFAERLVQTGCICTHVGWCVWRGPLCSLLNANITVVRWTQDTIEQLPRHSLCTARMKTRHGIFWRGAKHSEL